VSKLLRAARVGSDVRRRQLERSIPRSLCVTIPYVGRCLGSGKPPRDGSEQSQAGGRSGVCVTCSGRFDVEHGTVVEHETASDDERESVENPSLS